MEKSFIEILNQKIKSLGISTATLARLVSIDKENLYKWIKGTKPSDSLHRGRLQQFINGEFDQFIVDGKLIANYEYDKSVKIIFPRNPTNDFHGINPYADDAKKLLLAEEQTPYGSNPMALNKIIEMQDKEIAKLQAELEKCLQTKRQQKIA